MGKMMTFIRVLKNELRHNFFREKPRQNYEENFSMFLIKFFIEISNIGRTITLLQRLNFDRNNHCRGFLVER